MSITFSVNDNIKVAEKPLPILNDTKRLWEESAGRNVEAYSDSQLVSAPSLMVKNGFLSTVHQAYNDHRPLALSPDHFWLTIAQGLAKHINLNAEKLRHKFVDFEGKKQIIVERNGFKKGSPNNDWEDCFDEFSEKIQSYIGKKRDLIVSDFSTTGHIEKAASEVVLMDAVQSYFSYMVKTLCGFPSITLEGEVEDWEKLLDKVYYMSELGLTWWTDYLIPVIDKVLDSTKGNVDKDFWNSFLKVGGGSGGPYISGWINVLFPYLKDNRVNNYISKWAKNSGMGSGPTPEVFPCGLSSVPFVWNYFGNMINMRFVAGVIGASQDNLTLRPQTGWAVKEDGE